MSTTIVRDGLRVQQWDDKFFAEFIRSNKFARYMGTGESAIIQVKEDLSKKAGDSVTFQMIPRLKNTPVRGASTLKGAEERLDNRSQRVYVELVRNAVEIDLLTEQIKTDIDLRNAARASLRNWAMETWRADIIEALMSMNGTKFLDTDATIRNAWLTNNADRVLFGAAKSNAVSNVFATAAGLVDSSADKLTPGALSLMKRMAKTASPRIRPVRVNDDEEWFVVFANSLAFRDLKNDTTMTQANREAMARGKDNPLFTDGDLLWDGLIIKEIEDIPVGVGALDGTGGSNIDLGPVFLCGAQAVGTAWAQKTRSVDDGPDDYGRLMGVGISEIRGIQKLRFGTDATTDTSTTKDFGVVTGFFAAVADA